MTPHPRAIDRTRWQPRCYITDSVAATAIPPSVLNKDLLGVAVLVDMILTRILFLAQMAPGRFDK